METNRQAGRSGAVAEWSLRNGAPIPDAVGVKPVKGEGRGTMA